jgi:hypothetical protein
LLGSHLLNRTIAAIVEVLAEDWKYGDTWLGGARQRQASKGRSFEWVGMLRSGWVTGREQGVVGNG